MATSGIEIQPGLSLGQRVIGKLLEALHLEKLGEAVARAESLVIVVDGVERREPFFEAHFVAAAPGQHEVELFMQTPVGVDAIQRSLRGQTTTVTVEPGMVTVLRYTPHDGFGAALELVGTRPAT